MIDQSYQALLIEIRKTFPKKSLMVNTLADILRIDKGAVYRRLRQEVPFTFNEIISIAEHLNISLDNLINIEKNQSIPFQLYLPDYVSPKDPDFCILEVFIKYLQSINQLENSETASVTNVLPHDLSYEFHYLSLFDLFKWNFHYNNDKAKSFHQISASPKMNRFLTEYSMEMKKFNKTCYIFDNKIFRILVNDIHYFNSIRLMKKEDTLKIKEELFSMLDYLEKMAITGQFKETGNSVSLYISDIDITTSYTYLEAKNTYFSMVKTFILAAISSLNEKTFEVIKKWTHALIKISTLITLTNEKQRVMYFEKQRKIINEL